MRYTWFNKIADRLNLDKEAWGRIWIAAGIAIIISTIMLVAIVPSKGTINANMTQVKTSIAGHTTQINQILALGSLATANQLQAVSNTVVGHTGDINQLDSRLGNAETKLNTVEDDLAGLVCSPPEGYLTGTFDNYTLCVKSNRAGNFTANVHLVYSPAVGNATSYDEALQTFYASINWTAPSIPEYICAITFNGTAWGISQIWLNIGTFALEANNEVTIGIPLIGLNSIYEPIFAYVKVFPALRNS